MFKDFKDFLMRGKVMDLAVAVIGPHSTRSYHRS